MEACREKAGFRDYNLRVRDLISSKMYRYSGAVEINRPRHFAFGELISNTGFLRNNSYQGEIFIQQFSQGLLVAGRKRHAQRFTLGR